MRLLRLSFPAVVDNYTRLCHSKHWLNGQDENNTRGLIIIHNPLPTEVHKLPLVCVCVCVCDSVRTESECAWWWGQPEFSRDFLRLLLFFNTAPLYTRHCVVSDWLWTFIQRHHRQPRFLFHRSRRTGATNTDTEFALFTDWYRT